MIIPTHVIYLHGGLTHGTIPLIVINNTFFLIVCYFAAVLSSTMVDGFSLNIWTFLSLYTMLLSYHYIWQLITYLGLLGRNLRFLQVVWYYYYYLYHAVHSEWRTPGVREISLILGIISRHRVTLEQRILPPDIYGAISLQE